jgi:hypothetical protein
MLDFRETESVSPILAQAFFGHVLSEYYGAARPRGQAQITTSNTANDKAFSGFHNRGKQVEAQIASELTGKPLGPGKTLNDGEANNRYFGTYGPELKFVYRFQPGTRSTQAIWVSEPLRKK